MTEVHEFDALAAEYVLGTLDAGERAQAHVLLASNDGFTAKVKAWERRLGELHLMVEPVEPEWQVWERVKTKIGGFESNPFFAPPAVDKIKPEPEQAAPGLLPLAPQLPASPEPGSLESVSLESGSPAPTSPPPGSPEPRPQEPASLEAVARGPDSEHSAPVPVLSASRERFPAVPGATATGDVTRWRRSVRQWQALALLMTLVAVVLAGFVAALRNFPDRLPPGLRLQFQTTAAIPSITPPPVRPRAPPESQFDE